MRSQFAALEDSALMAPSDSTCTQVGFKLNFVQVCPQTNSIIFAMKNLIIELKTELCSDLCYSNNYHCPHRIPLSTDFFTFVNKSLNFAERTML